MTEHHTLSPSTPTTSFWARVFLKALILFVLVNLLFAAIKPLPSLGGFSAYNSIFPGRERLPYGENPALSYSLSPFELEAMLSSHVLSATDKPADEYRVLLVGDSSVWGFLLPVQDTLAAKINAAGLRLPSGEKVQAYNLGYPVMSLTKDLLFLSYVERYEPDLIVWPVTLESFPLDKQLFPPLLQNNPAHVRALIERYDLPMDDQFVERSLMEETLVGRRRDIADILRLQFYGVLWAATGIDQDIPETYTPRMEDLPDDPDFHELAPPALRESDLALDVLHAGIEVAGGTPVVLVNEPIFVSSGENSDLRYNFFYPRWAYDDYRTILAEEARENDWHYYDMWDVVDNTEFTNSAVHLTPRGQQQFAVRVGKAILEVANTP